MPAAAAVLVDDRLLIEELLVGLQQPRTRPAFHTTPCWYYRACRAAMTGAGGHLSGPFVRLPQPEQELAILSLLQLRDDIGLPDPRRTVPVMADLSRRHPQLNLLNLEATASAIVTEATVWLSEQGAQGVLPSVLDAEGITWKSIPLN